MNKIPDTPRVLPPPCRPGDRVAIVAPASPFQKQWLEAGVALLQEWGLAPVYSPMLFERWGYLAGADVLRASVLQDAFEDDTIQAVLCARGGYGCARLLEHLSWESLASQPKRFIGFSDVTILHLAFLQRTPYLTFHGPMVATSLMNQGTDQSLERTKAALFAETLEALCPPIPAKVLQEGEGEGHLIGGNLALLNTTLGTPWQPDFRGAILFLEDIDEAPYSLDRLFMHLQLAGAFDELAGLVLGDFGPRQDQYQTYDAEAFWRERVALPTGCPVLFDAPIGHIRDNWPVPVGAKARIQATGKEGQLKIVE